MAAQEYMRDYLQIDEEEYNKALKTSAIIEKSIYPVAKSILKG
jgi:hypothetical protein